MSKLLAAGAFAVLRFSSHPALAAEGETLKGLASAKGLLYGAAANYSNLRNDVQFRAAFLQQCGLLTAENELKWAVLRPSRSTFNFTPADWLVDFAQQHKLAFHGHTLAWHHSIPGWLQDVQDPAALRTILVDHITTVVGRYAGKVRSWDAVNEAVQPEDGRPDMLRNSLWLKALGPDYIDLAFRTAAAADPHALLVYNEHQIEYDTPDQAKRRAGVLRLLQRLKNNGVPVHALGVQSHLRAASNSFRPAVFRRFLSEVAGLGVRILITEMDVTDRDVQGSAAQIDSAVANTYRDYLSIALQETALTTVITWGLSNLYTWLKTESPRPDGAQSRPLPLDNNLQPTAAWKSIAGAFRQMPNRS